MGTPFVTILRRYAKLKGIKLPTGDKYAFKLVRADGGTTHGYKWKLGLNEPDKREIPDNWKNYANSDGFTHGSECPHYLGDGLCLAKNLQACRSGGNQLWEPGAKFLLITFKESDRLSFNLRRFEKIRVAKATVVAEFTVDEIVDYIDSTNDRPSWDNLDVLDWAYRPQRRALRDGTHVYCINESNKPFLKLKDSPQKIA